MTEDRNETRGTRSVGRRSKVATVIEKYGLDDLGRELETRWTGQDRERESLRDLADYFNERVLASALDDAGVSQLEGEVSNMYTLLTDDDVTSGVKVQTHNRLERDGIDVEVLRDNFVSHQAIHTYLRKHRNATHDDTVNDEAANYVTSTNRLENRLRAVTETNVERLQNTDRVDIGDFDVLTDVQILCQECGSAFPIEELVDAGSCDCR